ncbi:Dephospho-CoA kinase [Flagellimonas maritima]|uniref:Dephospho-CoA kinase n=1 Tax=Flagellimonas maritima TaxID=1383885 RepID=A0A2Z4LYD8_9FLAO|nr:dephospho-CoA kinase [Allomuricauda aurantiaca]AWX46368.1 Dephospho-CoA kinase [Allomuricauda aurantiaca]
MMIVGLTGGIGSGKSVVATIFQDLGIPVYNSDSEAKLLMTNSTRVKNEILLLLGKKAYINGELNKTFIAKKVFKSPEILEKLNKIVHPAVREHFLEWVEQQTSPYVIQETALIFENDAQDKYDYIILIKAPKNLRVERVIKRDGIAKQEVLDRIENQMDDKEKTSLADFCIENIDLHTTKDKVLELHQKLIVLTN